VPGVVPREQVYVPATHSRGPRRRDNLLLPRQESIINMLLPGRRDLRRLLTRVGMLDLVGWGVVAVSAIFIAYLFFATR